MNKIQIPILCPSCDSTLIKKEQLIYCINSLCPAQNSKRVEHFAKSLNIKGFGPKAIEKLGLVDPIEIYALTKKELAVSLNSEKLSEKVFLEIEKRKKVDLQGLLPGFSIPLMGRSASEKICKRISALSEITPEICVEAGLGPKVTENLLKWLEEFNETDWPFSFKTKDSKSITKNTQEPLGIVCISGKLISYKNKKEARAVLEKHGYIVKTSVTKDVGILINESGIESAKVTKARSNNITIITNLKELFGE